MRYHAANRFQTRLAASVDESQIYFEVESASGCPEVPFKLTVGTEIVDVIGVAGNTFTVQRGAEGTTPQSHPQGALVQNRWTAGTYEDLWDGVDDLRDNVETHVADFEAHLDQYEAHVADFEAHLDQYEAHVVDFEAHLADYASTPEIVTKESGTAIKFPSGLMICHKMDVVRVVVDAGAVTTQDWTYPEPFVSTPTISLTKKATTNNAYLLDVGLNATFVDRTSARIAIKNNYTSSSTAMIDATAIGQWK